MLTPSAWYIKKTHTLTYFWSLQKVLKIFMLPYFHFPFRLEELQVSDNELRSLDSALHLPRLRSLVAARNLVTTFGASNVMAPEEDKPEYRSPLTNVDLRHNRLKGSIILGNYEVRWWERKNTLPILKVTSFLEIQMYLRALCFCCTTQANIRNKKNVIKL